MTSLAVIYATLGRPDIMSEALHRLERQTRRPDLVIVSVVDRGDAGTDRCVSMPEVVVGKKGLCAQRNLGITQLAGRADIILFLDDDFVPADDYLEETVALFDRHSDLAGATGWVIADGIKTPGYTFADADAFLARPRTAAGSNEDPRTSLYGCNMAIRTSQIDGLEFDENLPHYGWLEDIDFSYRLSRRGPMVTNNRMVGVHLGVKGGRTSGRRFGYSQIANPIYMLRKGSAPPRLAFGKMFQNVVSNIARSLRPEPYVDRIGRVRGNFLALRDLLTGRLDPRRILEMP